jgi:hypothetical protein
MRCKPVTTAQSFPREGLHGAARSTDQNSDGFRRRQDPRGSITEAVRKGEADGRIMMQMGRNRIWRESLESSGIKSFHSMADRPIETEQPQLEAM